MDASLIQQMMVPPSLDCLKKVLCVQPHPDDNEIGMGGIISKLVEQGTQVDYLTITDGSLGDLGLVSGNLKEIRETEAKASAAFLGVHKVLFLWKEDGTLESVSALAGEIATVLREGQYDGVACPDPWNSYEAHRDHVVTGLAVAQAAINCSLRDYPRGSQTPPSLIKAVMFYFTQKPNTVVDITPYFQKKMESVAIHKSQITPEMLALYTGYFAYRGTVLSGNQSVIGEGVKVLAPIHLHCIPEAGEI